AGVHFSTDIFVERLGLGPKAVHFHHPILKIRKTHNKQVPFLLPRLSYWTQLLQIKPDIIVDSIYTSLTPRSYLNWLYSSLFGKERVLMDAGDAGQNQLVFPFERKVMRSAKKIFTYSPAGAARMTAKYGITDPGKFFIHLKLLDNRRFHLEESRISPQFTIGYVGRFIRAKGFDRFLALAQSCPDPAIRFLAIGPNTENFTLPDKVEHSGYVDNSRLVEVYSSIDLLILPDMRKFNGYPTVVQEALMCGTEVATGNLERSFYPKETGVFFFDPDQPGELDAFLAQRAGLCMDEKRRLRKTLAAEYATAGNGEGFLAELNHLLDPLTHDTLD
ncbi:MAG: glycosyltransferase, partial [Verrucomicrobiota bacterium]|nr:glycosyltransferase [Verrucomicrobiota bacterium]